MGYELVHLLRRKHQIKPTMGQIFLRLSLKNDQILDPLHSKSLELLRPLNFTILVLTQPWEFCSASDKLLASHLLYPSLYGQKVSL